MATDAPHTTTAYPQAHRDAVERVPTELFIGGTWQSAEADARFEVHDPATGRLLTTVADGSPQDGMRALQAAVAAQPELAASTPRQRADWLEAAYDAVMDRADELALVMTLEMGKPLAEARGEVAYAAEFLRHFAGEALRIDGGYQTSPDGATRFLVMKQPVGPSLLITPWNFPMAMGTRKLAPAIAAGCASVIKPAAETPLSILALVQILAEVGLPAGAVNTITTSRAGEVMEPMIRSGSARKLSFTGSTAVGKVLLEQCAGSVLRTSMELGGNAPFVVFEDADLDAAVAGAQAAKMRNMGEACTSANRMYVHESVAEEFGARLAQRLGSLRVGPGTEEGVAVGPLIDERARDKVSGLVDDAVQRGARVLTGGAVPEGEGHFYPPTVLLGVPADARMGQEEIFGPVAPITSFRTEAEALELANNTRHGLAAFVYTRDLNRALRMAEALESGMVGLNVGVVSNPAAPFGGVKESGLGREGGSVGIDEFLEVKYVAIADPGRAGDLPG